VCPNRRLVLVDTPGFDDSRCQGDFEILRRISVWLADVLVPFFLRQSHAQTDFQSSRYESKNMQVKVSGLVYLHNIGQVRMGGSSLLTHEIFRSICGPVALGSTVMASSQWDTISSNSPAGEVRERDLKEFWSTTLAQGAVYRRIDAMSPERDTKDIIDYILGKHAMAVQIQKELVELDKRVAETEAAQKFRAKRENFLGEPHTQDLSNDKEEELNEFHAGASFVRWVKGLFLLKKRRKFSTVCTIFLAHVFFPS
jgi:hypothetical protein